MRRGICKLCGKDSELQDSHLIPKAMYPPDAIWMNRTVSVQSNRQMKQYLLCKGCEDLFNKNGERSSTRANSRADLTQFGSATIVGAPAILL